MLRQSSASPFSRATVSCGGVSIPIDAGHDVPDAYRPHHPVGELLDVAERQVRPRDQQRRHPVRDGPQFQRDAMVASPGG